MASDHVPTTNNLIAYITRLKRDGSVEQFARLSGLFTTGEENFANFFRLPFVDAFRTFCLHPTPEGRNLLLGIRSFGPPPSSQPVPSEGLRL
jgi:hypothetical protein